MNDDARDALRTVGRATVEGLALFTVLLAFGVLFGPWLGYQFKLSADGKFWLFTLILYITLRSVHITLRRNG